MQRIYDTTKITPDEIISLVDALRQQHDDGQQTSYLLASVILFQRYARNDEEEEHKPFVIMQRMDCLTHLIESDERMRGWTRGEEDGWLLADRAVLRATALCRIRRRNGHAYFKPDEFFDLVLNESQPEVKAVV